MAESLEADEIRSEACPQCAVCGSYGNLIYTGQGDLLFGASGHWDFRQCRNEKCRLIWLDPMPRKEDLGKAYASYYTHRVSAARRLGLLKRSFQMIEQGYWANRYQYSDVRSPFVKGTGWLLYLFPLRRRNADGTIRFLNAVPDGRLLDVGCGSGDWLSFMRGKGWRVEGVDFDDRAVELAAAQGLKVRCGALEEQCFMGSSFDAIVMNHVIEHVPDPAVSLRECFRILKPGGKLVLFTPNSSSLGHKLFKEKWRGLEPPRHLHVFSMQSMRALLGQVGFGQVFIRPQIAKSVIYESFVLSRGQSGFTSASHRNVFAEVFAGIFSVLELFSIPWNPSASDCLAAIAVK